MKKSLALGVLGIVLGTVFGWFAAGRSPEKPVEPEVKRASRTAIAEAGDGTTLASLRARIADLERQLRSSGASVVTVEVARADAGQRRGPRGPEQMRAEMERIRREEPERYQRMTNFMARAMAARAVREQSKRAFFAGIATDGMTSAEKKSHDRLQELLAMRVELDAEMLRTDLSDDERRKLLESRRTMDHELRVLNETERDTLLRQTTSALGYEGDAAEEIVNTMKDIYEATETRHGPPGPPPSAEGAPAGAPQPPPGP